LILDESIRIQESYGYGAVAGSKSDHAHASAEQPRAAQKRVNRRKRSVA
jgi:hypothetical protein